MVSTRDAPEAVGHAGEVFLAFGRLGLTAFGGPIAHLAYFREEFVVRRRWLDERAYADLLALCQFLPGPASSQVGFALGLARAGPLGALAAFAAFTLPSAALLFLFAAFLPMLEGPLFSGAVSGLKIAAVAVVAQAVQAMARALCPDRGRAAIALLAVAAATLLPGAAGQVGAILAGAAAGFLLLPSGIDPAPEAGATPARGPRPPAGIAAAILFVALLLLLPVLAVTAMPTPLALFDAFYRAGALVFGGGHVVLPLLEAQIVGRGWVTADTFLAGYGAAQAVPGPLFTFAAFLGAQASPSPLIGAAVALVAIFLPGFLVLLAALPFQAALRRRPAALAAMAGANAAVVGILGAALYDPLFTDAIGSGADFVLALAGFLLLTLWRASPVLVVSLAALAGLLRAVL